MDYRTLGGSGCAVSSLYLGTMTLAPRPTASATLTASMRDSGTMVDAADVARRSRRRSSAAGSPPPGRRHRTRGACHQGTYRVDDSPNGAGLSARHLTRALDASLGRLGFEAVDLYQVHVLRPAERRLRRPCGRSRASVPGRQDPLLGAVQLHRLAADQGGAPCPCPERGRAGDLQPQYSLLARKKWEIVPAAVDAASACCRGAHSAAWLSGKYGPRDQRPSGATRLGDDPNRGMEPTTARHGAHLARHERGPEGRRGTRRAHGPGRARMGNRPARGQLDHPRRPHAGRARGTARGRAAPDRRRARSASTPPAPAPHRLSLRRAGHRPAFASALPVTEHRRSRSAVG